VRLFELLALAVSISACMSSGECIRNSDCPTGTCNAGRCALVTDANEMTVDVTDATPTDATRPEGGDASLDAADADGTDASLDAADASLEATDASLDASDASDASRD
jgi:Cys-rich repeat protein